MSYSQRVSSFLNFPSRELNALPSYNLPLRPLLELLKWDHQTCACFFSKCNLLNVRVSWFRKRTGARWLMAKFGGVCYRCCCSRTTAAAMTTQSLVLFSTQTEPSRRISVAQPPCTGFSFLAELNKTSFSLFAPHLANCAPLKHNIWNRPSFLLFVLLTSSRLWFHSSSKQRLDVDISMPNTLSAGPSL